MHRRMAKQTRPRLAIAIPCAALVLLAAACGNKSGSSLSAGKTQQGTGGTITIGTGTVNGVGTTLVSSGRTLYTLSADAGGKVTCTSSACTGAWPPLLLTSGATPKAGGGVTSSKLGTVKTPSGAMQVTYNSWPLYMYSGDSSSGQANGQGINSFGGVWHPMAPSGQAITGSSSSGTSSGGGGYGY
jgi:predicted lipoprotein with Yx(FWY)xxD motif